MDWCGDKDYTFKSLNDSENRSTGNEYFCYSFMDFFLCSLALIGTTRLCCYKKNAQKNKREKVSTRWISFFSLLFLYNVAQIENVLRMESWPNAIDRNIRISCDADDVRAKFFSVWKKQYKSIFCCVYSLYKKCIAKMVVFWICFRLVFSMSEQLFFFYNRLCVNNTISAHKSS